MKDLLIQLDHNSKKALYEQIYAFIRNEIADGKISHGEKLPSTRLLAGNLQISRSTVELAYEQLVAEGYLQTRPCAGYFVCDISGMYEWKQENRKETAEHIRQMEQKRSENYRITFSPFRVDEEHFPFRLWQKLNRNANFADDPSFFHAGDSRGDLRLRSVISSYLHRARGVNCEPEQIVLGAGNEYLLLLLAQMLGSNKVVAMEDYTYIQAAWTFQNMEYIVAPVGMDESGICIDEVKSYGADAVYVMPSHQFPIGTVMPLKRRMELLQWAAAEPDRYIIEDDHDSEFRYRGKPIPSLQGMDDGNHVIYLGTFSKSIAQSVRVSYMVLPKKLLGRYLSDCGFYSTTVPRIQQEVLYRFLENGDFERHLNRMKNVYKTKQECLLRLLKKQSWVKKIYGENAGFHVNVELNTTLSEAEVLALAEGKHIKLFGLSAYRLKKGEVQKPVILLLGYGNINEAQIKEGIEILSELLDPYVEKQG
ncbi:MAG: PLP-dependent aminotransferase family protein [Lachnospiraceae bacterium]|nr:PLP-dependent aminotransferase family protein [Lachnospiraceae bacterium]